jgi:hypothetical protein
MYPINVQRWMEVLTPGCARRRSRRLHDAAFQAPRALPLLDRGVHRKRPRPQGNSIVHRWPPRQCSPCFRQSLPKNGSHLRRCFDCRRGTNDPNDRSRRQIPGGTIVRASRPGLPGLSHFSRRLSRLSAPPNLFGPCLAVSSRSQATASSCLPYTDGSELCMYCYREPAGRQLPAVALHDSPPGLAASAATSTAKSQSTDQLVAAGG